jgi:hypothetical protein
MAATTSCTREGKMRTQLRGHTPGAAYVVDAAKSYFSPNLNVIAVPSFRLMV